MHIETVILYTKISAFLEEYRTYRVIMASLTCLNVLFLMSKWEETDVCLCLCSVFLRSSHRQHTALITACVSLSGTRSWRSSSCPVLCPLNARQTSTAPTLALCSASKACTPSTRCSVDAALNTTASSTVSTHAHTYTHSHTSQAATPNMKQN